MLERMESDFSSLRVLLVDDDEACRGFLAVGLELEGLMVVQVQSAEDAMEALKDSFFDAIATDVNLPGADGFTLLRHVREHIGDIPVILITGYSSVRSAVDALKLGAQDYLAKPLENADALLGSIWKAVEHHRVTMQNKALQERLGRAEKMESLANIAGGVAHDLNNIISPMVSLPDIIISELDDFQKQSGCDIEEIKEDITLMKASGLRAASVVRDLMTSSRRLNFEPRALNLNMLVHDCIGSQEIKEVMAACPEVQIETELVDADCVVMASETHVPRAVSNLIRNAIEAMDENITGITPVNNVLKVKTRLVSITKPLMGYDVIEEGDYAVIRVSDSGIGMSDATMPRILEPFFTTKKESGRSGSGLGLAVVHGVMKDHHGFIDIQSTEGSGTMFDLYFPLSTDAVLSSVAKVASSGGDENVLVVDDEPAQRIVAGRMLKKLGYTVDVVNNGHEALDRLRETSENGENGSKPFDLVILDMIMEEGFDGLETLKEIRTLYPNMKAVIASGFAPTGRVQSAIEMGAAWLGKPYCLDDLARVLRRQLDG